MSFRYSSLKDLRICTFSVSGRKDESRALRVNLKGRARDAEDDKLLKELRKAHSR